MFALEATPATLCRKCRRNSPLDGKSLCKRCHDCAAASQAAYRARRRGRVDLCSTCLKLAPEPGVAVEPVDEREIFERDGWHCRYCGRETPEQLRGQRVPSAPTLDHVIAIARAGAHEPTNLVCACFDCNVRKGPRIAQPRPLAAWSGKPLPALPEHLGA